MPEERIKILTGAMFGRIVLITRRADGNFTYRPEVIGEWSGVDCGIYDSAQTAESEAWAIRGEWLDGAGARAQQDRDERMGTPRGLRAQGRTSHA
jgi:hypothetical protein